MSESKLIVVDHIKCTFCDYGYGDPIFSNLALSELEAATAANDMSRWYNRNLDKNSKSEALANNSRGCNV